MLAEILCGETKGRARQRGIIFGWPGLLVVLGAFLSPSAGAEILYDKDGIQLQGTARLVTANAATCHVRKGSHPDARYEELKANDGQPLHVWQLDYSAHNRTGSALWYLRAEFDVKSEYPPCTNWTGEGLSGGRTESERYSDSVSWGDQSRILSAPAGMARGESRHGILYLAVFHTDQPSFEGWRAYVTHKEPDKASSTRSGQSPSETARTPAFPPHSPDPSSDQTVADAGGKAAPGVAIWREQQVRLRARDKLPFEPEMVAVPAGSIRIGCVSGQEVCDNDEYPVHEVRVEAFELSKYEVTFEDYDSYTAATGRERVDDEGWGRGRRPAINIAWEDAVAYARWLSDQTGESYRLPSEAEWEYAARAGTRTKYHFGNDRSRLCEYGNHADRSTDYGWRNGTCSDGVGRRTAIVGMYRPNPYGIHDMNGNVWEWVQDCWNSSHRGAPADGTARQNGDCSRRVLRGGGWNSNHRYLRSAFRSGYATGYRFRSIGFRVARTVTP